MLMENGRVVRDFWSNLFRNFPFHFSFCISRVYASSLRHCSQRVEELRKYSPKKNRYQWRARHKFSSNTRRVRGILAEIIKVEVIVNSGFTILFIFQSIMGQVAKRASVLKRRKSKNKMDSSPSTITPDNTATTMTVSASPTAQATHTATTTTTTSTSSGRRGSEGDMIFYIEEPKAGNRLHIIILFLRVGKTRTRRQSHIFSGSREISVAGASSFFLHFATLAPYSTIRSGKNYTTIPIRTICEFLWIY